ncbi:MAG: sigma-54-dependent Fis family transcriptional regulator [Candidatus Omnitrophica bacterium]|nr:sigma-54-dependent Fis family transcriptional regulator [Candidatus Omnitrophota bacterium]
MLRTEKREFQILIVDDEPLIRESLYEILRIEGYGVQMTANAEEAMAFLNSHEVDIVITDYKLPTTTGLELLADIKRDSPKTEVIVITGYGSIGTAVEAMKNGAYDYITKPIDDNEFKIIISKIVEKRKIIEENEELKQILARDRRTSYGGLIGSHEKMQNVYRIIDSVASTNATILISGESGTGKGLLARAIHGADQYRKDKPFVEISCGALSETLLESELFGHIKGAFTGAIKDKEGRFEFAKGGTVFLDEIDAFSPNLQVKLLRVLQDGVFERVGDNITRKAEARIVVATNQQLTELVERGKFREDPYYRINVISIHIPPLRERKSDIDALVSSFIAHCNAVNKKQVTGISEKVREMFLQYDWPGNIRELENAVEGALIMTRDAVINEWDIPNLSKFTAHQSLSKKRSEYLATTLLKKVVEEPEKEHILAVLEKCGWNRSHAAVALGVNRTTLYNKMKKYNITKETHA